MKDIKGQYDENKKILLEKSNNDDKYIIALKNEVEKIKQQLSSASSALKSKEFIPEKPKPDISKLSNDSDKVFYKKSYFLEENHFFLQIFHLIFPLFFYLIFSFEFFIYFDFDLIFLLNFSLDFS